MPEISDMHDKIIEILKKQGPGLPIQISKQLGISSLFASAYLAELSKEKRIKTSHLKVGGSPLYLLEGQEQQLEKFYKYMHPKEAETFLLLKKKKILKDSVQQPATRVALRSIRDFAIGFKKQDEIFWRYAFASEKEIIKTLKVKKTKPAIIKPTITKIKPTPKQIKPLPAQKPITDFQNPLIIKPKKKQKPKSEFVLKTIDFLNKNNLKIIEEKDYKPKEYNCVIQIRSNLGLINFLTQAKNKKTISEADLRKLLSNAQSMPLPALMLYTGKLSKKAKEYAQKYFSILKTQKI